MEKSINEHQEELIKLQRKALEELAEDIIRAKFGSDVKDKVLTKLDVKLSNILERIDKKRALINHYHGKVVV